MTRDRDAHEFHGQRIWIVGASSGIGAALATELVGRGARVAISARRADALESVSGGRMTAVVLDVTDAAAVERAAAQVYGELGGLDVVIWSAGYWQQFDAMDWDPATFERHIEVNLLGFGNVLAAVVPRLVAVGRGHIVGIASVAGYRGLAGAEAYGATKAAQINLLEALRASLWHSDIRVTTVCPGFVRTEMTATNTFPMPFMIEPEDAARAIVDGIVRRRTEIVFPLPMALLMKAARFVPARLWPRLTSSRRSPQRDERASSFPAPRERDSNG